MAASSRSAPAFRALCAFAGVVSLVQACGARSDTEDYLFGSDGSVSLGGAGAGGRGGASRGGTTPVAGRAPVAGTASGGRVGVAGTSSLGGEPASGGAGGSENFIEGGAGGAEGQPITCGGEVCDASTQVCCLAGSFRCIAKGDSCSGPALGCTSHADCGGEVCCLSLTGDASNASSCKPSCNTRDTGRDRQLCDTDADCQAPFRYCRATVFGLNLCVFRP